MNEHETADLLEERIQTETASAGDGFDLAYPQGMAVVLKELQNWDGGISENFLKGIQEALRLYEEWYR